MLTLAAWLHDLDPFLWRITDTFGLRWYGLSYVAGFIAAWLILHHLARRRSLPLRPEAVPDLIMAVVLGALLGGRLGYALFYKPHLFTLRLDHPPWWGLIAINEGGMASHGGMIGVILASAWFAHREKLSLFLVTDALALVAPIGLCFGRIANFINGELLGSIVANPGQPAPWWAVRFPQELLDRPPPLTAEQSQRLADLLLNYANPADLDPESDATIRMIASLQRGQPGLADHLAPLISARHPSQLYQAFTEGLLLLSALWLIWLFSHTARRVPGFISAGFLILYGVGRVLTELIRLPDAHLASPLILGLSRGQWLSLAMIALGAVVLCRALRARKAPAPCA